MADSKISALPAATTPLAGTEVLPIVQSGVTKQVSVANLTTGRAISATELTLSTGNLVIGTAGKGIDFSATPGTGTSELLDDYEEGTWTTSISGETNCSSTVLTVGKYVKVGTLVTIQGSFTSSITSANLLTYFNFTLPFNMSANNDGQSGNISSLANFAQGSVQRANASDSIMYVTFPASSQVTTGSQSLNFTLSYYAA